MDETCFELTDLQNYIRIKHNGYSYPNAFNAWYRNWVNVIITTKAGLFRGEYPAQVRLDDFKNLKRIFTSLYNDLSGSAIFSDLERYLKLNFKGDGIGHFEVDAELCDRPGIGASYLSFSISFDQTYIKTFINQLNELISV